MGASPLQRTPVSWSSLWSLQGRAQSGTLVSVFQLPPPPPEDPPGTSLQPNLARHFPEHPGGAVRPGILLGPGRSMHLGRWGAGLCRETPRPL